MKTLKRILTNPKDVFYYLQGKTRYKLFYSKRFSFLIPFYIRDQISFRILVMDEQCYNSGSCKLCGCETTALQMANKPCDKPCYPEIMRKSDWKEFKKGAIYFDRNGKWKYDLKSTELKLTHYDIRLEREPN